MSLESNSQPLTQPGPLLAAVSRSFYLSLRFLPEPVRGPLALGYLLARTSDTLADAATVPIEERLHALNTFELSLKIGNASSLPQDFEHWKLSHSGEQALLRQIPRLLETFCAQQEDIRRELLTVMTIIIGGQREDLSRFGSSHPSDPVPLANRAELEQYTYSVAGCVGEFWTRICALQLPDFSAAPIEQLLHQGRHFGQGLQLVNILRDLPADLRAGRCYLPLDELTEANVTPATLLTNPTAARPVLHRWLTQAEEWLDHGRLYENSIRGIALKFSVGLPRRLGQKTLHALKISPPLETQTRVKISRASVLGSALESLFCSMSLF